MSLPVKFTTVATEDVASVYAYIAYNLCNRRAADNLLERIDDAIEIISQYPYMNHIATEPALEKREVRKHLVDGYVMIYKIFEDDVWVLRVQSRLIDFSSIDFIAILREAMSEKDK